MRVAMVSEHANPLAALGGVDAGGQNVHVAALAGALADRGAEVVVYTRRDDPASEDRVVLSRGVVVEHVPAGPPSPVPKDELVPHLDELAAGLGRRWRRWRPDVVHAHFWMSGMAALAAGRPLGIPVVETFHALGTVKRRFQGPADTSPPCRIREEIRVARSVEEVIATCRDETRELAAMGADLDRVSVVPCGVDVSVFRPRRRVRRPPAPRLAVIGRLVERKGIEDVLEAMVSVPGAELVVAGGPEAAHLLEDPEASRLVAAAEELGVAARCRFVGRLARSEVADLIRSSDLVVTVPWYEPFGIVPLEAMACGTPVVASDVGGLSDSVVPGVTGMLVPPRQPDALALTLRQLLAQPDALARMGRAGVRRAHRLYRWPTVAAATERVYDRVRTRHLAARTAPHPSTVAVSA